MRPPWLGQTAPSSFDSRVFLVAPYSGLPSDWLRFERDFFSRLEREFRPDSDDYSLGDTIAGIDPFGPDDPDDHVNDPASSARAKLLKAHERRNRILASHILGHILDENLKSMIRDAHHQDVGERHRHADAGGGGDLERDGSNCSDG
eukprot:scaffold19436_cov152-Isochrysis_galbana.AAC.5